MRLMNPKRSVQRPWALYWPVYLAFDSREGPCLSIYTLLGGVRIQYAASWIWPHLLIPWKLTITTTIPRTIACADFMPPGALARHHPFIWKSGQTAGLSGSRTYAECAVRSFDPTWPSTRVASHRRATGCRQYLAGYLKYRIRFHMLA